MVTRERRRERPLAGVGAAPRAEDQAVPTPRKRRTTGFRTNRGKIARAAAGIALPILLATIALSAGGPRRPGGAVVIPIRGDISDIMKGSIERRLAQAQADGATTVIFEIDTPGGLVTSALAICQLIKNLPGDVRSVAWVHPRAYSAGAMIALSCNEMFMSKRSSIGACAPIMVNPAGGLEEMPAAERAKMESPILEEFRDSAVRNGYDPLLASAMVSTKVEVWWLEDPATGERRFVSGEEKTRLIDKREEGQPAWRLVETYRDPISGRQERARQPVDPADELLTVTQSEAVAYGLAKAIASDLDEVAEKLALTTPPVAHDITGWEQFVMWLNSPLVRGILFAIVLIGAYIEFQQPGLILPGVTAAVALLIFLGAPYAAGLADIWTFVLLGLGLILVAVEIFVIPGYTIAGLLGGVLILVALIGTFVPAEPLPPDDGFRWVPHLPGTWAALQYGVIVLASSVIVSVIGIVLILKFLPQLSVGRHFVPENPRAAAMALTDTHADVAYVGAIGIVTGDLRPGGQARFGLEAVDVQTQGEYVSAGRRVQVIKHEGMRIVVRPLPDEPVEPKA